MAAQEAVPALDRRQQAAALAATRRRLFLIGTVVSLAAPLVLWATGVGAAAWNALAGLPVWLGIPLYVALITLMLTLVAVPLGYYGGYVLTHRYGLSTQTLRGWIVDWSKSTLLGLVLATAAGSVFYLILWATPTYWWIAFGVIATLAILTLTFIAPYVIVPIFFKPEPLDDPAMVELIESLAERAKTSVAGVSRLDFSRRTNEANAAVIGYGRSRRVVLADTLLSSFTPDEIEAVVAHELGHHVHRDVRRLMIVQTIVMFLGLGLAALVADPLLAAIGAGPLASPSTFLLVLAAAEVFGLLTMPFLNGFSRKVEAQADTYAFDLLGSGRAFADAMRRLADQNLAEERPPRWAEIVLCSHPPIAERIARAEAASRA
jgi:Zn-dependent protease with chaperone function